MNTTAFSFLDLLRRRRELPLEEVVRLCGDLPKQLDELTRTKQSGSLALASIAISIASEVPDLQKMLGTPVTGWPHFEVHLWEGEEETYDRTMVGTKPDTEGTTGPKAFSRLLYELLGGKQRTGIPSRRVSPLPALNEEGNAVIRQALQGEAERESCTGFWQRLLRASDVKVQSHGWRIPRWLLPVAQPGEVLNLVPADEDGIPIALVARSVFRIGRSRSMTDFPTRLLNRAGQLDEQMTVLLSRVQALAEAGPDGLTFRDGNGKKASANGSTWNGQALSCKTGTLFSEDGELVLGGTCRLAVSFAPGPEESLEIENLSEWWTAAGETAPEPLDFTAVVFRPVEGQQPTRDAVWVGRGLGFNVAREGGGLTWEFSSPRSPAQFLVAHGCFWLANSSLEKPPLRVNEAALGPGQIAPLASEQSLEIGGRRYAVTVE